MQSIFDDGDSFVQRSCIPWPALQREIRRKARGKGRPSARKRGSERKGEGKEGTPEGRWEYQSLLCQQNLPPLICEQTEAFVR